MTTQKSLLQSIRESPFDDNLRLVYADWLEENGDPDQAEMIRLQCELRILDRRTARANFLTKRTHALLNKHYEAWAGLDLDPHNPDSIEYDRGTLRLAFEVEYRDEPKWQEWMKSVSDRFTYFRCDLEEGKDEFSVLRAEGWLDGVTQVSQNYLALKGEGVDVLEWLLKELREINVFGEWLDPTSVARLASLANLQSLAIGGLHHEDWLTSRASTGNQGPPLANCPELLSLDVQRCWDIPADVIVNLPTLGKLKDLSLETKFSAGFMASLGKVASLEKLFVGNDALPEECLKPLIDLPNFRELTWFGSYDQRSETLRRIGELKHLQKLDLGSTTDAQLATLKPGPKLESLSFRSGKSAPLQCLPEIPTLRTLNVFWSYFPTEEVAHVTKFPELRALVLSRIEVSANSIKHLVSLKHLEDLALDNTPVDDSALPHFVKMPSLKYLSLRNTKFSENAVKQLREERPDIAIVDN